MELLRRLEAVPEKRDYKREALKLREKIARLEGMARTSERRHAEELAGLQKMIELSITRILETARDLKADQSHEKVVALVKAIKYHDGELSPEGAGR